ncbi:MAG: hypothetical protein AAF348_19395 [Bacteroidota bacterium]
MLNISTKGEELILKANELYIAIDSLYLNDIKREINNLDKENLLSDIKDKVFPFPYTDIPFATFSTDSESFPMSSIIKINYDTIIESEKERCFSTDTGLIVLLVPSILEKFMEHYDYEDLVDSMTSPINLNYWSKITNDITRGEIGLVLAPGTHSGFEFEGSGVYKINS